MLIIDFVAELRKLRLEFVFEQYLEDYSSDFSSDDGGFAYAMICGREIQKYRTDPGDAFISSVTARLAFSQIPDLVIEVYEVSDPDYCPHECKLRRRCSYSYFCVPS